LVRKLDGVFGEGANQTFSLRFRNALCAQ
jgi:hypothetical protein